VQKGKIDPATPAQPKTLSKLVVGGTQLLVLTGVLAVIVTIGIMMFRRPVLEQYLQDKTGYTCTIGSIDFDPKISLIELHNLTIWNKDPYPHVPLGEVRRVRLEWNPLQLPYFPKKLRLLEIEVQSITLIRLDGNRFNILDFVEAVKNAWGRDSGETSLNIDESWIQWDYIIALDAEKKDGKRMEVLIDYEGNHQHVTRIRELTDPPMELAKAQVDGFYFFNYLGDRIMSLLR
jgi:hypothetical protein